MIFALVIALQAAPGLTEIGEDVRRQCRTGEFSGTVVVIEKGRETLRVDCQPEGWPRITSDTKFKFFSMSKMLTGVAIARLAEEGKIDVEAPISRYLPDVPPAWADVRVIDLLHHTSGIPDLTEGLLGEFQAGAPTHREGLDRLLSRPVTRERPLAFATGSRFSYSNFGYELLARIGAAVTDEPFDRVLHRLVLQPAGMRSASIARPRFTRGKLVGAHPVGRLVDGFNGGPGKPELATSLSFVQLGAGAVIGSAYDLAAFSRALGANRLVSPRTAQAMSATAYPAAEGVRYGYGMMHSKSNGCAVWRHSGGVNGYASDFARLPDLGATVIVMSNAGFARSEALRARVVRRLTEAAPCTVASGHSR